jgi:hypothetical protein
MTHFTVRAQAADSFIEYPSEMHSTAFQDPVEWVSDWPFEEFQINYQGETVLSGTVGQLIHRVNMSPEELRDLEILYVGQAFGKDGERNAFDRLKSHSTLQAIYAENRLDHDIWLTLCEISDVAVIQETDVGPAEITGVEDGNHIIEVLRRVDLPQFYEREALAMAEAGLIRYFMPQYNEKFKRNYPDPKHVHISTAYDLDFADLFIELQEFSINARFWSADQHEREGYVHTIRFPLRATGGLLSLLIPGTSRGAPGDASA